MCAFIFLSVLLVEGLLDYSATFPVLLIYSCSLDVYYPHQLLLGLERKYLRKE